MKLPSFPVQDMAGQQALQKDLVLTGFADSKVDVYEGVVMVSQSQRRIVSMAQRHACLHA